MNGKRIGVFLCQCGTNIGRIIDIPKLAEELKGIENVTWVEYGKYLCSEIGLTEIRDAIIKFNLDRVVIGACTPRNLEKQFFFVCQDAGLNPYLLEMVNLREQCSWVHLRDKEGAMKKAKELMIMGISKAKLLEPQYATSIDISPNLLVVGGGVSGMTAAVSAARQGHQVLLIEKEKELGGLLKHLDTIWPTGMKSNELIDYLKENVKNEDKIEVMTSTELSSVEGSVGRFNVKLKHVENNPSVESNVADNQDPVQEVGDDSLLNRTVGAIILATGSIEAEPIGHYHYGEDNRIMTQIQFEGLLKNDQLHEPKELVFIQCVGARGEDVPYCSRVCCITAIKNAIKVKQKFPNTKISILHRDIFVAGALGEQLFKDGWDSEIEFHYYSLNEKPDVRIDTNNLVVRGMFGRAREELTFTPDLLVLSTPLVSHKENLEIAKILKIPVDSDNFLMEKNPKIYPMDTQKKGIYLCGCCHEPGVISKCIAQGQGAASRASIQLSKEFITLHPMASVDTEICRGCGRCVDVCPNDALELVDDEFGRHAKVNDILCQGCGTCCATCWTNAIHMNYFHSKHLNAMVDSLIQFASEEGV
jgi:heterodisulfide reductase subunit A